MVMVWLALAPTTYCHNQAAIEQLQAVEFGGRKTIQLGYQLSNLSVQR